MNTVGPSPRQQQDQEALMADLHDDPPVPQGVNPNMEEDDPMGTVEWINPTTGLPRVSTWRIFDVEITKPMRQTIVQGIPTRFTIILPTGPIFPQSKRKMPFPEGSVQQTAIQAENPELCWIQLQAGWWQLFHWTTPVEETPVPLPPKETRPTGPGKHLLQLRKQVPILPDTQIADDLKIHRSLTREAIPIPLERIKFRGLKRNHDGPYLMLAARMSMGGNAGVTAMRKILAHFMKENQEDIQNRAAQYLEYNGVTLEEIIEDLSPEDDNVPGGEINELTIYSWSLMTGVPVVFITRTADAIFSTHFNCRWDTDSPLFFAKIHDMDMNVWWEPLSMSLRLIISSYEHYARTTPLEELRQYQTADDLFGVLTWRRMWREWFRHSPFWDDPMPAREITVTRNLRGNDLMEVASNTAVYDMLQEGAAMNISFVAGDPEDPEDTLKRQAGEEHMSPRTRESLNKTQEISNASFQAAQNVGDLPPEELTTDIRVVVSAAPELQTTQSDDATGGETDKVPSPDLTRGADITGEDTDRVPTAADSTPELSFYGNLPPSILKMVQELRTLREKRTARTNPVPTRAEIPEIAPRRKGEPHMLTLLGERRQGSGVPQHHPHQVMLLSYEEQLQLAKEASAREAAERRDSSEEQSQEEPPE